VSAGAGDRAIARSAEASSRQCRYSGRKPRSTTCGRHRGAIARVTRDLRSLRAAVQASRSGAREDPRCAGAPRRTLARKLRGDARSRFVRNCVEKVVTDRIAVCS